MPEPIILQSHDVIYKRKWMAPVGEIATIGIVGASTLAPQNSLVSVLMSNHNQGT